VLLSSFGSASAASVVDGVGVALLGVGVGSALVSGAEVRLGSGDDSVGSAEDVVGWADVGFGEAELLVGFGVGLGDSGSVGSGDSEASVSGVSGVSVLVGAVRLGSGVGRVVADSTALLARLARDDAALASASLSGGWTSEQPARAAVAMTAVIRTRVRMTGNVRHASAGQIPRSG
jgi:hypothetical protein